MTTLVDVTDYSFDPEVLKFDLPVLADFWAEWCAPCHALAEDLQAIGTEYEGRLKIVRLDIDENPNMTSQYSVLKLPTLILFKNGQEVERIVGRKSQEELREVIVPHLLPPAA